MTVADSRSLRRVGYGDSQNKGIDVYRDRGWSPSGSTAKRPSWAFTVGATAHSELLEQTGMVTGAAIGVRLERPTISWELRA